MKFHNRTTSIFDLEILVFDGAGGDSFYNSIHAGNNGFIQANSMLVKFKFLSIGFIIIDHEKRPDSEGNNWR